MKRPLPTSSERSAASPSETTIAARRRLSLGGRFGYGVGDFAFNLYFQTASLYLLLYYTDVLGLSAATGGWIFAAALIWDAVADPVMGAIANRTRTRWGRYRPYILVGAVPLAASWALLFLPVGYAGTALTLYALAVHVLFRTLFTVVSMPFLSLSAVITTDSDERGVIAGFRMVAAMAAGLFVAFFTLPLVRLFGGSDQALGFFRVALLFGGLSTLVLWLVFASTSENVDINEQTPPTVGEMVGMLRVNGAFWCVAGLMLMIALAATFFTKSIPYLFKYAVGRGDLIGTALSMVTGMAMVSIPIWTQIMKRTSKRAVAMAGPALGVVAYVLFWIVPTHQVGELLIVLALSGFATGAGYLTFWAMIPDTVEFGEWRTGVRAEGAIFGLISFVQKAALGIGVGLLGEMLGRIGYIANRVQATATIEALRFMMLIAPVLFGSGAVLLVSFYPLRGDRHDRIVRILAKRRPRA